MSRPLRTCANPCGISDHGYCRHAIYCGGGACRAAASRARVVDERLSVHPARPPAETAHNRTHRPASGVAPPVARPDEKTCIAASLPGSRACSRRRVSAPAKACPVPPPLERVDERRGYDSADRRVVTRAARRARCASRNAAWRPCWSDASDVGRRAWCGGISRVWRRPDSRLGGAREAYAVPRRSAAPVPPRDDLDRYLRATAWP